MVVIARRKVNSKAFAIPILTACAFIINYSSQNRDSKCFRINFSSSYNNHMIEFHLVSIVL